MKAIIFDCDGTLVDSEPVHFAAWQTALKKHNYSLSLEEYMTYVGTPVVKTAVILEQKIGTSCAEELVRDKNSAFHAAIKQGIAPIQGTYQFLKKLVVEQERHKFRLAVASGAPKEEILIYLRHLKIEGYFDFILSGVDDLHHYNDPEGINKPKPYIYLEAAKKLGVAPAECIAIEDSYPGVMAGVRAGCHTVAIPTPFSCHHDFSAAHRIIPSLQSCDVNQFLEDARLKT